MKSGLLKALAVAIVTAPAVDQPPALAQGSLTPPGAPATAMRTLAQIEPRTPITNVPYTITLPGSYYLATNCSSATHGIVIQASRVTLDLMGFSLTGDRGSGDYGIWLDGAANAALRDITVRGGMVSGFGDGVRCEYVQNSRVQGLMISSNRNNGVYLQGQSGQCDGNTIADCAISDNSTYGVCLDGLSGQCDGNTLIDCAISGNGGYGVWLTGATSGRCNGNTIAGCTIADNAFDGIDLFGSSGQCNGNIIADCAISGNGSFGGIHLAGDSGQCDGNSVVRCVLRNNTDYGINIGNATGNRVENNHVSGTTGTLNEGIYSTGTRANVFLQNSCVGQPFNLDLDANDTFGPIVTNSGALTTNGAAAHPWANFSR